MTNKEILQDALNILEPIPKGNFITDKFTDFKGKCCALGHYAVDKGAMDAPLALERGSKELRLASVEAFKRLHPNILRCDLAAINNFNDINGYTEPEIKDRVIHFLKDAVAIEEDF